MPPAGLAILIGAGPNTGTGIARILSHPSHGNLALAILARSPETLSSTAANLARTAPGSVVETFSSDTSPKSLSETFAAIRAHQSFDGLKLRAAVYNVKHAQVKNFMTETHHEFVDSLTTYVGGAMAFAQESLKLLFEHHSEQGLAETRGEKKGTIIFTGTLGAMRSNARFASYGAGRAGVRQLSQSLGKEFSEKGVHVVHVIANGSIVDDNEGEDVTIGEKIKAESVGKTYLWLIGQEPDLWTSELDIRPALEKY
ncbi:hypothetical protein MMC18_004895 [Xylographa bjoerkii]|nr:hypothetical protein [Xylographa bjoerkii]